MARAFCIFYSTQEQMEVAKEQELRNNFRLCCLEHRAAYRRFGSFKEALKLRFFLTQEKEKLYFRTK